MMNNNPRHIVTGQVRLSYVNLLKPYAREGQGAKYSATILVPKTDTTTKARIDAAINAAKQDGPAKWGGVIPPIVAIPVHDGDGVRPSDGMPFGEECKGHWVFTASSKIQPEIVDLNINPILDPTEIYSGLYARVGVTFFAYNAGGKKGIGCGLETVQKLQDGEPLSNRASASDDFGSIQPAHQINPITGLPL